MDYNQVIELAKNFPNNKFHKNDMRVFDRKLGKQPQVAAFSYSDETIDGKSKTKAYALFESSLLESIEVETINDREMFMKGIDYSYYYEEAE